MRRLPRGTIPTCSVLVESRECARGVCGADASAGNPTLCTTARAAQDHPKDGAPTNTMAKVYVGNLSWNTTDDGLAQAFSPYGQLTDYIVMKDRDTGRSRGFGFVTFMTQQEADAAIMALNEEELDGRRIRVNMANSRPPTAGAGMGANLGYAGLTGGYGAGAYGAVQPGYAPFGSQPAGFGYSQQAGYGVYQQAFAPPPGFAAGIPQQAGFAAYPPQQPYGTPPQAFIPPGSISGYATSVPGAPGAPGAGGGY